MNLIWLTIVMVISLTKSHKLDTGSLQEDSFRAIFPDVVYVDGAKIVHKRTVYPLDYPPQ